MSNRGGKGKKRSKSYYLKCAHKTVKRGNSLDVNMKGFLVTCNGNEKAAVREMYNLLNEYADKLYGPEQITPNTTEDVANSESDDEDDDNEDVEAAMKKEVAAIKEVKKSERRFQNTSTKSRNTIFIKTNLEDPCSLAHNILSDIYEKGVQKSRFALRMLPVETTCKARFPEMEECGKALFKKYFETPFGTGLSYTTIFTKRNNNELLRDTVIPKLGQIIKDLNPLHRVNHVTPDFVVLVEVIGNLCCLSVLRDFFKFKKYNLIEVSKVKSLQSLNTESNANDNLDNAPESTDALAPEQDSENDNGSENDLNDQPHTKKLKVPDEPNIASNDTATATNVPETSHESLTNTRKRKAPSLSREETEIVPPPQSGYNFDPFMNRTPTVIMENLNRSETVVMQSLPRSETVAMENLEREESTMDALSKGESAMEMSFKKVESTMDVLQAGESVMIDDNLDLT